MRWFTSLFGGAIWSGLLLLANSADATVIAAHSNGFGLYVHVSALNRELNAGPLPNGSIGTAPAPYNLSDTDVNVSLTGNIPQAFSGQIGVQSAYSTAASNVDGLPGSRLTTATGGVVNAQFNAQMQPSLFSAVSLLSFNATVGSSAQISGDFGSLVASGNSTFQVLDLAFNSIPVDLSAYIGVSVAPNTSVDLALLGIANFSLVLNEQIVAPDQGVIIVNAFHLKFALPHKGAFEAILGHSEARAFGCAVPEPTTLGLIGCGLLPMTCLLRPLRRRHRSMPLPSVVAPQRHA